jgi:hypothetical protein
MRTWAAACGLATSLLGSAPAGARSEPAETRARDEPSREEIEAWLESRALPADISADPAPDAPPPPPRAHGFVLEGALGALGHVGDMRFISPLSPWFHLKFGWEPIRWLMLYVLGDVAFGSTSLAYPPPPPRGYALWALGAGVRATWEPLDALGLFVQGEIGGAEVSSSVLATYGFRDADSLGPFFGGGVGLKVYPVNPHLALVAHGGVRNYTQTLDRQLSGSSTMAWIGAAGIAYTF